jgi:hypothetical protein
MKRLITVKEIILLIICPIIGLSIEKAVDNTQWFLKLTGFMKIVIDNMIISLSIIGLIIITIRISIKSINNYFFTQKVVEKYNVYMRNNDGLFDVNRESWAKVNIHKNFSNDEINILIKKGLITLKIDNLL